MKVKKIKLENYVYLKDNNQISYIKTLDYESKKKKSYKNNIGIDENIEYISEEDCYICENNRKLNLEKEITRKTFTGYQRKVSIYSCNDCSNYEFKRSCIKIMLVQDFILKTGLKGLKFPILL